MSDIVFFPAASPPTSQRPSAAPRVIAVVVTRDRPQLLRACLAAVEAQARRPDAVLVVDNASGAETRAVLAGFPRVRALRQEVNRGGAGGFRIGIAAALADGADWVWMMDDDGRPQDRGCLGALLRRAEHDGTDLVAPLVLDAAAPERLAFPLRIARRTCFDLAGLAGRGDMTGFAHLFNGALVGAKLFLRIGLPEPRFVIRGDEVEFLLRARRAGARIVLATDTFFLHPASTPEIHPILGGLFYATLPGDAAKQFYQFRNRGWIFRHYGMWAWLAADLARYGWFFLATRRDPRGFAGWIRATRAGLQGGFMREAPPPCRQAATAREAEAPGA